MPDIRMKPLLRYLPFLVVVALTLWGAIVPVPEPHLMAQQDKLNHGLAFVAFAVTLRFAHPRLGLAWVMAWAVAFGAGIEVMQAFIPGRDSSFWDVVADAAGGGIGCLIPARAWAWLDRWF
jgi:VanZ family protein